MPKLTKHDLELIAAAELGNIDEVKRLLSVGAGMDISDRLGNTVLKIAVDLQKFNVAAHLIESGADLKAANRAGVTVLMSLVRNKTAPEAITLLIQLLASEVELNTTDSHGHTAFMLAAACGNLKAVSLLSATKAINFDHVDNNGYTALMLAARQGNLKVVKFILSQRADVNVSANDGSTALLLAVAAGAFPEVVSAILVAGASVRAADKMGRTALHLAIFSKNIKALPLLLTSGADVDALNKDGDTALLLAVHKGDLELIAFLLAAGADVTKANKSGKTALSVAADKGEAAIVSLLGNPNLAAIQAATSVELRAAVTDLWKKHHPDTSSKLAGSVGFWAKTDRKPVLSASESPASKPKRILKIEPKARAGAGLGRM